MDMDWYHTAERYISRQEWPVRLQPLLRENGLHFEVENPLLPAGILVIPSNWEPMPVQLSTIDSIILHSGRAPEVPSIMMQHSATEVDMPLVESRRVLPVVPRVFVYNPYYGRRPYARDVKIETNIKQFASVVLGALPHGVMLFKHLPEKKIYVYNAGDIWMWEGNVDAGLKVIEGAVQQHVAREILLSWNQDLRRYLVIIIHPSKCALDWEADFDKANITQLFDEVTVDRILAYNSSTSLMFTMTVAAARIAVQTATSVT